MLCTETPDAQVSPISTHSYFMTQNRSNLLHLVHLYKKKCTLITDGKLLVTFVTHARLIIRCYYTHLHSY